VQQLDDTVGEICIPSLEILKASVLLSPAVLTLKEANKKNPFTQTGFYCC